MAVNAAALEWLGPFLRRSGFTVERATQQLGAPNPAHLLSNTARYAFAVDWVLAPTDVDAARVLTELFLLNRTMCVDVANRVLGNESLWSLVHAGFLTVSADSCQGTVSITPFGGQHYLSDQLFTSPQQHVVEANARPDLVMPPHASSVVTLDMIRRLTASLMDIGCGSGIIALDASARCARTRGIDLNPRCIDFARANRKLSGNRVSFDVGDVWDLRFVPDERFDHLVFNAPTALRTDTVDAEYGQTTAEQALEAVIAIAPQCLRPGGTAHILAVVEVPAEDTSVQSTVHRWLAKSPVGVTVSQVDSPQFSISPRLLAAGKLNGLSLLAHGTADAERIIAALRARGVNEVGLAMINLQL